MPLEKREDAVKLARIMCETDEQAGGERLRAVALFCGIPARPAALSPMAPREFGAFVGVKGMSLVKLVSVMTAAASVALLAACGGGPTGASGVETTSTAPSRKTEPAPSWTKIDGIELNTLESAVIRNRGRGTKLGDSRVYRVGKSSLMVWFEDGRVTSLRTSDPIVALPDGVRIGPGSIRFPMDWRSMGTGAEWKGYWQSPPEEGLESSGEWEKIVRQRDGSGVLVRVDLGVEYALNDSGKPHTVELTWLAPGYQIPTWFADA